jgi:carbon monoxide dehydrogenase subunit G
MRRTTETRRVPGPIDEVFDYLADFTTSAEWDPGVVSARRLDDGPVRAGSRFDVQVRFAGRTLPMTYRVERADRPTRLELTGVSPSSTARDVIALAPDGEGHTRVTWTLEVTLTGWSRLAEPLLGPLLRRLGRKAMDGLAATLDRRSRARRG